MPLRRWASISSAPRSRGVVKYYPVAFEAAWMPFAFDSLRRRDAPALFAGWRPMRSRCSPCRRSRWPALAPPQSSWRSCRAPTARRRRSYRCSRPVWPCSRWPWFPMTSVNIAKQTRIYPMVTAHRRRGQHRGEPVADPPLWHDGRGGGAARQPDPDHGRDRVFRAAGVPDSVRGDAAVEGHWPQAPSPIGAMTLLPSSSPWQTLGVRAVVMLLFPLGPAGPALLRASRMAEIRKAAAAQTLSAALRHNGPR